MWSSLSQLKILIRLMCANTLCAWVHQGVMGCLAGGVTGHYDPRIISAEAEQEQWMSPCKSWDTLHILRLPSSLLTLEIRLLPGIPSVFPALCAVGRQGDGLHSVRQRQVRTTRARPAPSSTTTDQVAGNAAQQSRYHTCSLRKRMSDRGSTYRCPREQRTQAHWQVRRRRLLSYDACPMDISDHANGLAAAFLVTDDRLGTRSDFLHSVAAHKPGKRSATRTRSIDTSCVSGIPGAKDQEDRRSCFAVFAAECCGGLHSVSLHCLFLAIVN